MKIQELRLLAESELLSMKTDLQDKIIKIRFRSKVEPAKNIMEIRQMKQTIARINTLFRESELKV